jgi:putative YhdH/YhfP family quinone oxidoreductase
MSDHPSTTSPSASEAGWDGDTFRAYVAESADDGFVAEPRDVAITDLPEGEVLIAVEWSGINYKDTLASMADGRVARISPLVPGIDLAGRVLASTADSFAPGDVVLAHGYDIGVAHHGGLAQLARVPAGWVIPMPDGLDTASSMALGTAGYTAGLSVLALLDRGLQPADGPVVVTGATGGVGSVAVSILAGLGFEVVASSGKADATEYLVGLGASEVIGRFEVDDKPRPLRKERWAGAVDVVGGTTLAHLITELRSGAAVAASGNTGGADLATSVFPFILRGVALLGIDSVPTPIERRRQVWGHLAGDLEPAGLDAITTRGSLSDVGTHLDAVRSGSQRGRVIIDVNA